MTALIVMVRRCGQDNQTVISSVFFGLLVIEKVVDVVQVKLHVGLLPVEERHVLDCVGLYLVKNDAIVTILTVDIVHEVITRERAITSLERIDNVTVEVIVTVTTTLREVKAAHLWHREARRAVWLLLDHRLGGLSSLDAIFCFSVAAVDVIVVLSAHIYDK